MGSLHMNWWLRGWRVPNKSMTVKEQEIFTNFTAWHWGSMRGLSTLDLHTITISTIYSMCQKGQHSLAKNLWVSLLKVEDLAHREESMKYNGEWGRVWVKARFYQVLPSITPRTIDSPTNQLEHCWKGEREWYPSMLSI